MSYTKGVNYSTGSDSPNGKYLEIKLKSPGLSRRFDQPGIPASNCAYLAYHALDPAVQKAYDYFKVTLSDSAGSYTFNFPIAQLAAANRAYALADAFLTDLQRYDFLAAVNACNSQAFGKVSQDTLLAIFKRMPRYFAPFKTYIMQGYKAQQVTVEGRPQQLMGLFVTVPRTTGERPRQLMVFVNPQLKATERYLYGFHLVQ